MSKEFGILLAATIAAVSSFITLLLSLRAQRSSELRVAHRDGLEPFITELSEALHANLATSNVILKTASGEAFKRWQDRSNEARKKLKELRPKLRYSLWGLDEGLLVLSRFPDWIQHLRSDAKLAEKLLKKGNQLRRALDYSIRNSYIYGRPPAIYEKLLVRYCAWKCRRLFSNSKSGRWES